MVLRCLLLSLIFIFSLCFAPFVKGITENGNTGIAYKALSQKSTCIDSCKGFFDYVPEKNTTNFELLFQRKLFKIRTNPWKDLQLKSPKGSPAYFYSALSSPCHFNLIIPVAFRKLLIWFRFPYLTALTMQFTFLLFIINQIKKMENQDDFGSDVSNTKVILIVIAIIVVIGVLINYIF